MAGTGPFSCSLRFILRACEPWCLGSLLCRQLLPGWGRAVPLAEDIVLNKAGMKHPPWCSQSLPAREENHAKAPSLPSPAGRKAWSRIPVASRGEMAWPGRVWGCCPSRDTGTGPACIRCTWCWQSLVESRAGGCRIKARGVKLSSGRSLGCSWLLAESSTQPGEPHGTAHPSACAFSPSWGPCCALQQSLEPPLLGRARCWGGHCTELQGVRLFQVPGCRARGRSEPQAAGCGLGLGARLQGARSI